jgi:hypothetical protein
MPAEPKGDLALSELEVRKMASYTGQSFAVGEIYLLEDEPVLGIHCFPDYYTLCWASEPDHPELFARMATLYADCLEPVLARTPHDCLATATGTTEAEKGLKELQLKMSILSGQAEMLSLLSFAYLKPLQPQLVNVRFELGVLDQEPLFGLWADLDKTPGPKETGFQAPYGVFPGQSLSKLITGSSPTLKQLPPSDLINLLEAVSYKNQLIS